MSQREPIPLRVSGRTPSWPLAPPDETTLFFWAPCRRSNKAPDLAGGCEQRANCTAFWRFFFFKPLLQGLSTRVQDEKKRSENFRISRRKNMIFFFFNKKNTDTMKTTTVSWLLTCCLFVSVLGFSLAMRTLCCWRFFSPSQRQNHSGMMKWNLLNLIELGGSRSLLEN